MSHDSAWGQYRNDFYSVAAARNMDGYGQGRPAPVKRQFEQQIARALPHTEGIKQFAEAAMEPESDLDTMGWVNNLITNPASSSQKW
jgi:hypothetical protein